MTDNIKIRIGTRGSKLALAQTEIFKAKLQKKYPHIRTETKIIKTTGDLILDKNLYEVGGKGLFVKEIEEALLNNQIDVAIHSMKDMPAFLPDGLNIVCVLKRETPEDALISTRYKKIADLPLGASIGTSSPRRASQLLYIRPDIKIVNFRGNVGTRIEKLQKGEVDASFLAVAGLKRLNIDKQIYTKIPIEKMLPAIAQGAIGIEARIDDKIIANILKELNHSPSYICIKAEREFLKVFGGSCYMPIAAYAKINEDKMQFSCMIISNDGKRMLKKQALCNIDDGAKIAIKCAFDLKNQIDDNFFS